MIFMGGFEQRDYIEPTLSFSIPEEIFHRLSFRTQEEKLKLWIDMIDISSDSEIFDRLFREKLFEDIQKGINKSQGNLRDFDFSDSEFRDRFFTSFIERLYNESPMELLFLSERPFVVINGISVNFSHFLEGYDLVSARRMYFAVLLDDIKKFNIVRYDSELERRYIISQIGNDSESLKRLQDIFLQYNFSQVPLLSSPFPMARPEGYDWDLTVERSENQYEKLRDEGFSPEMLKFIQQDIFPELMGEDFLYTEEHITRLRNFAVFLIDMETTEGTQLQNTQGSTASGYTQLLNEIDSSRGEGRFNSIDTRIRESVKFYSNNDLRRLNSFTSIDTRGLARAGWVQELWEFNESGRDGSELGIDNELRLLFIFLAQRNPDNLRSLILGENTQDSARQLYQTHHTNVIGEGANGAANSRLEAMLSRHFL